jgi:hypothetical protein
MQFIPQFQLYGGWKEWHKRRDFCYAKIAFSADHLGVAGG